MHNKRHSVFISSTFDDLAQERQAVQDAVVSAGDFPVQMESFPAADEDQFAFIKTLIDRCDFFVLIIDGRYGTVADDGMSYTERYIGMPFWQVFPCWQCSTLIPAANCNEFHAWQ